MYITIWNRIPAHFFPGDMYILYNNISNDDIINDDSLVFYPPVIKDGDGKSTIYGLFSH